MKFLTLSALLKSKDILSGLGFASTPKLYHYRKSQFRKSEKCHKSLQEIDVLITGTGNFRECQMRADLACSEEEKQTRMA